jgi:hypothetical protein
LGKLVYQDLTDLVFDQDRSFCWFLRKKLFNQSKTDKDLDKERKKLAVKCCQEAIKVNQAALTAGYKTKGDLTDLAHLYFEMAQLKADNKRAVSRYLVKATRYLNNVIQKDPDFNLAKYYLARVATFAEKKGVDLRLWQTVEGLWNDLASRATLVRDNLSRSFVCTVPEKGVEDQINFKIPRDPHNLESVVFEKTILGLMHEENEKIMAERGLEENYITVPKIIYASPNYLVLENIGKKTFYHWLRDFFIELKSQGKVTLEGIFNRDGLEKNIKKLEKRQDFVLSLYKQAQEEMIRQKIVLGRLYDSGRLEEALAEVGINLRKKIQHFDKAEDYVERFEKSLNKVNFNFGKCTREEGVYLGKDENDYHYHVRKGERYTKKHLYVAFMNYIAPKLVAIEEKGLDFDTNPTNFPLGLDPRGAIKICGGFDFETLRFRAELFMFSVLLNHEGPYRTFFRGHYQKMLTHNLIYTLQEKNFGQQVSEKNVSARKIRKDLHDDFYVSETRFFTMIGTNQNKLRDDLNSEERNLLIYQQKDVYLPNIKSRLKSPNRFLSSTEKKEMDVFYDMVKGIEIKN